MNWLLMNLLTGQKLTTSMYMHAEMHSKQGGKYIRSYTPSFEHNITAFTITNMYIP